MKGIVISILLVGITALTYAQGMMNGNGQMPTGAIYGKVLDSITGKPIDAASIQLIQTKMDTATKKPKKVVVNGMLTQANGDFRLEGIPVMGQYSLLITGIGYKSYNTNFSFIDRKTMQQGNRDMSKMLNMIDRDLGNIKLSIDNQTLANVTVTASKPLVQLGIDRKIYNVDKDLTSAGGTAQDVMKNIPSVSVDIDGNVTLRNSSPQLFVDGRPTTLTLDQIPADQIETIEVITNPSAKFDASGGTSGILNIVLKKNKRVGYNGNVRLGIDQLGKLNGGANLNLKQGKFNFFVNANVGQRKSISDGTTERTTKLSNNTTNLLQTDRTESSGNMGFGRAGFDYFIDNRNTVSLSGMLMRGKFGNITSSNIIIDSIFSNSTLQSRSIRETNTDADFRNGGGTIGFVHNFPKSGHQLTSDVFYNKMNNEMTTEISNANSFSSSFIFRQLQNTTRENERFTFQTDYANPINEKTKFESGIRFNSSRVDSKSDFNFYSPSGSLVSQPLLSSKYNFTDRVIAAYSTYSSKIGDNFGYQLGLRLESSSYDGLVHSYVKSGSSIVDSVSNFKLSYPISFFPSVFLSQKLSEDQELQLNYSRRINRPNFFQLFPFTDYSDSLNLSRGNPNLKPEFTNSIELSYSKSFNRDQTILLSTYYKYTTDLITRYQASEKNPITNLPVLVTTYTNANSSFVGGFEVISKNKIAKWWDVTTNLNLYTSKINSSDPAIQTADQLYSWFGKINNTFKLPKNFTLQLSGDYNSKTVLAPGGSSSSGGGFGRGMMGGGSGNNAQGYTMPNYGVDAALKYDFLKNKVASLTLSVSDIFKTRKSDIYTSSSYFSQHAVRTRDQQFFRLNFSLRFGKFDTSLFKRKNTKSEQESMQSGMEGAGGQ